MTEPIITRTCKTCKKTLSIARFHKAKDGPNGYRVVCGACANLRKKTLYDWRKAGNVYERPTEKTCAKCGVLKPITEFTVQRQARDGRHCHCKACQTAWRKRPEILRRLNTQRRAQYATSERREKSASTYFIRTYGITADDYLLLVEHQRNRCAICGDEPVRKRLSVDHCHRSGAIRGLLCDACNRALGGFRDDVRILQNAIHYLSRISG